MKVKITRHFMTDNNKPAVEYERVTLWGTVARGKSLTDGLEGQALIDRIEKDGVIGDKFTMSGKVVDKLRVGSIEWRWQQDADAGAHLPCPRDAEMEAAEPHSPPKPPKPEKAETAPSSASASIPTHAAPMHAQER